MSLQCFHKWHPLSSRVCFLCTRQYLLRVKMYTLYFRPCDVWQFRQLSIELRRTGLRDATNDVRVFFLPDHCPRQHTLLAKNGIPDQTDGIYTLFQTKMAKSIPYFRLEMLENHTLWGGTYLHGLYMGVPPPPPRVITSRQQKGNWRRL